MVLLISWTLLMAYIPRVALTPLFPNISWFLPERRVSMYVRCHHIISICSLQFKYPYTINWGYFNLIWLAYHPVSFPPVNGCEHEKCLLKSLYNFSMLPLLSLSRISLETLAGPITQNAPLLVLLTQWTQSHTEQKKQFVFLHLLVDELFCVWLV